METLVADFKRTLFATKSEKADHDRYQLSLEDIETAIAAVHAEDEEIEPSKGKPKTRNANRGTLPKHLPRIEEVIEPETRVVRPGTAGCPAGQFRAHGAGLPKPGSTKPYCGAQPNRPPARPPNTSRNTWKG